VESDVSTTLSELERKLKELERELESVGRGGETDTEPAQAGWSGAPATPPPPPGTTPFTAVWSGGAAPPSGPPPQDHGAPPPVRVAAPAAPWGVPAQAPPPPPPPAPPPPAATVVHRQLDELIAFRDRLVRTTDDLVSELSRVLTELGAGAPDAADTVLSGDVTVAAGPFADLATLAAFEQALARIPGVTDVYVRSLDQGAAAIDVRLAAPLPLAAALRTTAPVPFAVVDVRDGHLTLSLSR
jgi:hypothetical protein